MLKIKSIKVLNGLGDSYLIKDKENGIDNIKDLSKEYENSFYSMYLCCDKNNKVLKSIEQCSVIIDYYKQD